ncbi:peptidyl-tRNA hydrolase isoform X2 [Stigmatopora nigra]
MDRVLRKIFRRFCFIDLIPVAMSRDAQTHIQGRRRMVVGLGNPGMEGTRHCVGIQVVCALAAHLGLAEHWRSDRQLCGEVNVVDARCLVLLRPQVLMNVNGVAVAKAASKYGVQPEDILLVHDEMDKPLGKVAIKHGGSARKTTSLSTPSTSMSNIIIVPIGTHQYHTCHKQRFSCGNPDAAQSHLDSASCGPQRNNCLLILNKQVGPACIVLKGKQRFQHECS